MSEIITMSRNSPLVSLLLISMGFLLPSGGESHAQETQITRGAWLVGCGDAASGKSICQMQRDVLIEDSEDPVIQVLITRARGASQEYLRFITPLGVSLRSGLSYTITRRGETGDPRRFDYQSCQPNGCFAMTDFAPDEITAFKKSRKINVTYFSSAGQPVNVSIDLKGFTAAHRRFEKMSKAPR